MRLRTCVTVILAALSLSSCQWFLDPTSSHNGPQVAVVGDSITVLAHNQIRDTIEPNHALIGNAVTGAKIATMLPWLESHLVDSPIVVENLGTNDVNANPDWQADLNRLLTDLAGTACVELVTINQPSNVTNRDLFNAKLVAATGTYPNMHVIDWAAAVGADPLLLLDRVHPSTAGNVWLADAYAAAIANDCP